MMQTVIIREKYVFVIHTPNIQTNKTQPDKRNKKNILMMITIMAFVSERK